VVFGKKNILNLGRQHPRWANSLIAALTHPFKISFSVSIMHVYPKTGLFE